MLADTAAQMCKSIAHECRLHLLQILLKSDGKQAAVSTLAARLDLSVQSVRRHIKVLADANLVNTKRQGRQVICVANSREIRDFVSYLRVSICEEFLSPEPPREQTFDFPPLPSLKERLKNLNGHNGRHHSLSQRLKDLRDRNFQLPKDLS